MGSYCTWDRSSLFSYVALFSFRSRPAALHSNIPHLLWPFAINRRASNQYFSQISFVLLLSSPCGSATGRLRIAFSSPPLLYLLLMCSILVLHSVYHLASSKSGNRVSSSYFSCCACYRSSPDRLTTKRATTPSLILLLLLSLFPLFHESRGLIHIIHI